MDRERENFPSWVQTWGSNGRSLGTDSGAISAVGIGW